MESVRAASEAWRQQMRLRIDQTVCDRQEELRKIQRSIEQVVTVMTAQRDSVAEKMKEQDAQLLWKGNELLGQLQQVSKMYTPPSLPPQVEIELTKTSDDTTSAQVTSLLGDIK